MPIVQVAGLATNYEKVGTGPTLVLLHGWANTWEAWLPIIPVLSDHFTLVLPDLPGCGKTETPDSGWSTPQHAVWLQEFLTAIDVKDFSAVGHSFGGKILLEFVTGNYSPQPKKLVLIDASGIPNTLTQKQRIAQQVSKILPRVLKEKFRKSAYDRLGLDSDYVWANEFQRKTLQMILKEDYTNKMSSIAQATLILWGKQDTATPLWQGESMHTLIPLNQMQVLDSGHFPHHEYPEKVAEEICQFL